MGKLRKSRSRHAIPGSVSGSGIPGPAAPIAPISQPQPAAPAISQATATAPSPIALKTAKPSAAAVSSYNHDDSSISGSPVPTSIDFVVGSPSSSSHVGEQTPTKGGRPKSVASKQSSSSLRSTDKHQPNLTHPHNITNDNESIYSNLDHHSTSASALSLLRERLHDDEAARKRRLEEEAEKAAGPRKLHKKRGPSEANSPPSEIAEEGASVADEATVVGEEDEESKKVTQIGQGQQTPLASPELNTQPQTKPETPAIPLSTQVQPIRSRWVPTVIIPRPGAVFTYATATAKSTAHTAFKVAALPVTIPLNIARQVPLLRVLVPAIKESPTSPTAEEEHSVNGRSVAGGVLKAQAKVWEAKEEAAGLAWKTAELSLGLGIAAVLVGAAGADYAFKSVTGWRRRNDKPAGFIH